MKKLLLGMGTDVPEVARSVEFVMLLNEMHLMNKKLTSIAESLHKASTTTMSSVPQEGLSHG